MKRLVLVSVILSIGMIPAYVPAATWCSTNQPNAIYCEDFDGYSSTSDPEFRSQWPILGSCTTTVSLDTGFTVSPPFAAKTPTRPGDVLDYSGTGLPDEVRAKFGSAYSSAMGTDLHPLVWEFVINGQTGGKIFQNNSYAELGYGYAKAPTDYIRDMTCTATEGGAPPAPRRYPIICQQNAPPAGCPPISTAPHQPAIAAGMLAYLDNSPCPQSPTNSHLAFFDGLKWWSLKQGLFPEGSGNFLLQNELNYVRVTIKLTTLKVELNYTGPNSGFYSWCIMPRDYTGPFANITLGFRKPCALNSSSWTCPGDPDCIQGAPDGAVPRYDNIVLYGGQEYAPMGACCFPDQTCVQAYRSDCEDTPPAGLGGTFTGDGTTCATVACCPPFQPDHNMDDHIDLADFGWFQSCLTGPGALPADVPLCGCADFNGDGDVDGDDLITFSGCMTGPEVPTNPNCLN